MKNKSLFLFGIFFFTNVYADNLVLGIVPQQSPIELIKDWQPIVDYLQKSTGDKIDLQVERSIPEFEKKLYSGKYDFAYMNPYHYVLAHQKQGYIAHVRDEKNLTGILVTRKESGMTDVSMLKGKQFLFPAPDAFAATLLIKYELLKKYGINVEHNEKFRYVNSHDSVYKGISRGVGDVGGGIQRTLDSLDDIEVKKSLTVIYKTTAYPSHPFALKPTLSGSISLRLNKALLAMPIELQNSISMKHLVETNDGEYKGVRDIAKVLQAK